MHTAGHCHKRRQATRKADRESKDGRQRDTRKADRERPLTLGEESIKLELQRTQLPDRRRAALASRSRAGRSARHAARTVPPTCTFWPAACLGTIVLVVAVMALACGGRRQGRMRLGRAREGALEASVLVAQALNLALCLLGYPPLLL